MLNSKFDLYKSEWLELVFKDRNQQYGAYEMRAHYGNVMSRAMAVTFFSIAVAAGAITILSHRKQVEPIIKTVIVDVKDPIYHMPPPEKVKPQPKQEQAKQQQQPKSQPISTTEYRAMKPVPDAIAEEPKKPDPTLAAGQVDKIVAGSPTGVQNALDNTGSKEGGGAEGTGIVNNDPVDANIVQVMPEPFGGAGAWSKFLQKNLHYPGVAREESVSGKVYLSFIIEKDGHLSDITVLRKAGYGFDEEALRVLKLAPAWKPGMQNGQPVRVRYTIPINFQINE